MKVRFTPRALLEAEKMKTWWHENRPVAPDLFDDEMAIAVERMRTSPTVAPAYPSSFGRKVRRVLMPRTKNHIYYTVRKDEIVVLSVWGAPRGKGPKL